MLGLRQRPVIRACARIGWEFTGGVKLRLNKGTICSSWPHSSLIYTQLAFGVALFVEISFPALWLLPLLGYSVRGLLLIYFQRECALVWGDVGGEDSSRGQA